MHFFPVVLSRSLLSFLDSCDRFVGMGTELGVRSVAVVLSLFSGSAGSPVVAGAQGLCVTL